ncbi:hypothetical protein QAD02_019008 [Eretmocerus hayati]|uniref:Uncharacterized protein n=1 Tax=Eretmocerus hayati TaxID=131215 RepID=A0ACC2PK80_9HYME|nr:hypothetical protein QAD02_019008 [Eretmocerus hayati]
MGGNNCKSFSPSSKVKLSTSSADSFSSKCSDNQKNDSERTIRSASSAGKGEGMDYIEDVVCDETDIKENEMKLLPLGADGGKILLIKQKGELHAIGTKCTHYGALLNTGALGEGRVRCPWHGACFNIKTGDIEDYPGLDSLPCYKVTVSQGKIRVKAKRTDLSANRKIKDMCKLKPENEKVVVIVGGGPAGATCAETLRQQGFDGRVVMICKETVLPYDRVKVSKVIDFDVQKALLRSQSFYDEHSIETRLGVEATSLNTQKKSISLSNGEELCYDYLFIATGSKARKPDIPGVDLKNIFLMRDHTDAEALNAQLSNEKHMVILGFGFIGMETAAFCANKCASVTIIGRTSAPFEAVFGQEIGERIKKEFEDKGVKFVTNSGIKKILMNETDPASVGSVELNDGTTLPADILILGVGSTLYTEWLKGSCVNVLSNGSIEVDEFLKTNIENIYAGGDIAYAPVYAAGVKASIGHYSLAHYHGRIAAMNICQKNTPLRTVPYFWTTLFGKSYRYSGYGNPEKIRIYDSLMDLRFFAYHIKDGKVIAMSSVARDPIVSDFANYIHEGKFVSEEEIEQNPTQWMRHKPKDFQIPVKQTVQLSKS